MNDHSRRLVYRLITAVAVAIACGRILSAQLVYEPSLHRDESDLTSTKRIWPKKTPRAMPTFSSNDRSRWATVRAIVDEGTYVIGQRDRDLVVITASSALGLTDPWQVAAVSVYGSQIRTGSKANTGIIFEEGWGSVDKVLDPNTYKYYSSKPPLLATLVAGLYWLLQVLFGWTLQNNPDAVVRTILILIHGTTFWIYLALMARIVERYGRTDWGRFFVLGAAAFATLMTPFQITLNNHTLATVSVLGAIYCLLRIWETRPANMSPGEVSQSGWLYYWGAGLWSALAAANELPALAFAGGLFLVCLRWSPSRTFLAWLPPALVVAAAFFLTNHLAVGSWRPVNTDFGSAWYYFEGSHFRLPVPGESRSGIDFAKYQESRWVYAFHLFLGHHGWFSLTPIWLLALCSISPHFKQSVKPGLTGVSRLPPFLPWFTFGVSLVVFAFYLVKTDNYGGWTNGPRWLMWLSPPWLICLLPVMDRLGQTRAGRGVGYVCLCLSIFSAHYSLWNPWRHPWIFDFMQSQGWPGY